MKPDNKKRRSKEHRPKGYYGNGEKAQSRPRNSRELKAIRKWLKEFMKNNPQDKHHLKIWCLLL